MSPETDSNPRRKRGPDHHALSVAAGREGAREVLRSLGIDVDDAKSVAFWHAKQLYIEKSMKGADDMARWVKRSAIGVLVTSALYFSWDAFWAWAKQALVAKAGG